MRGVRERRWAIEGARRNSTSDKRNDVRRRSAVPSVNRSYPVVNAMDTRSTTRPPEAPTSSWKAYFPIVLRISGLREDAYARPSLLTLTEKSVLSSLYTTLIRPCSFNSPRHVATCCVVNPSVSMTPSLSLELNASSWSCLESIFMVFAWYLFNLRMRGFYHGEVS